MKNFYTFLITILVSGFGFGQMVTIDRANGPGPTATDVVSASITAQGLTRGSGIAQQGGAGADFRSDGWIPGNSVRNEIEYIQWSVTAVGDFQAVITALDIQLSRGANGPVNWQIFYSLDGFADPGSGTDVTGLQTATITSTDYSFPALNINSGVSGTITFRLYAWGATNASGIFTIEGNTAWAGTLGVPDPGVRLTGNVIPVDTDTSVTAGAQPAGAAINSKFDTAGEAVDVFQFVITDLSNTDTFPTNVNTIRLKPHTTNDALWSDNIEGVTLNNGSPITTNNIVVTDNFIDIDVTGNLNIADNTAQPITVGVYLKSIGAADGNIGLADGSTLSFFIDASDSGFVADPFNSGFADPFTADVVSNDFTIAVEATKLTFLQQPSDVAQGSVMTPAVQVAFTDDNGNVDVDYLDEILIESGNGSLFTASLDLIESVNGIATFDDLIFTTEVTGEFLTASDFNEGLTFDFFDSGSFNITTAPSPTTYTYNGSWSPIDPNGVSASTDAIVIASGDATITTNTDIYTVTVSAGGSLTINSGVTFRVVNDMTLESSSTSYSSFIFNGNPTFNVNGGTVVAGDINYKRFVNSSANGNDLISSPLTAQGGIKWVSTFLATDTNAADLLDNGATSPTLYAFGTFNKTSGVYETWAGNDTSKTLTSGTGYRAATDSGTTLTFTGDVLDEDIIVNLQFAQFAGATFPDWNLIGNPYPSYLSIADYLGFIIDENGPGTEDDIRNIDLFATGSGIYGYDANPVDTYWDVITLGNAGTRLMAPGQGFLVPASPDVEGATTILSGTTFNRSMRRTGSSDDFILGRNAEVLTYVKLSTNTETKSFTTQFYFNENSSLGLDHGYDGKLLGSAPSFALYSHLVQENTGLQMALQCLHPSDLVNTTVIPLGVNSNAGEQITFSITESTLPDAIEVYLEDTVTNTYTLLNSGDYTLTPTANLNGTGRFYLRFGEGALSTTETTLNDLNIYSNPSDKTIVIAGQLMEPTTASVYDLQGRLVNTTQLVSSSRSQTIDVSNLSSGVYVVQLNNGTQNKTQKVILR